MATLTWIGGGNDKASNPANWSLGRVPQPGDTLDMTQGVMNLSGNALAGDTLTVSGFSGDVEINTRAAARLNLATSATTIPVNVHVDGTLNLTAQVNGFFEETVIFSGGTIRFVGTSTFRGSHTVFDDNLVGSGTINVANGSNGSGASELMEVDGSVGRGLTFDLEGIGPPASLQIDDPRKFHGVISLPPASSVPLVGSVNFLDLHVTSADLRDDILRMFDGRKLVDTVRLGAGSAGFNLAQSSQGVILSEGADGISPFTGPRTAIPLHIS